ncbi:phosphonate C-P lyase system protein PhnG [Labrys wisconsinensis]|uniref:Alpha-D-ribose 1-methylphosphonate 5-triphosphate synthase subunit PhnG n=1 Tax=Labrys wisconsinensis TaxID=425677 RepID=A0ABU0JAB4_9HYPH|nr:phosphonate C-P lyase system protein PhnG [Labrys wisconsinensis]MDQ0471206.1 alpha-D-ribose 1-methylphosphonate 5-triphosphate synthase subunit PhnG [Labrys wisconsinensis]
MATAKPQGPSAEEIEERRSAMRLCAEATRTELAAALQALAPVPAAGDLRRPETGLVMLRGRAGGDGAAFNLGEASVVRAAIRLEGGGTGFAYHLGRDAARARQAAILDALWQQPARRQAVEAALAPVAARLAAEAALAARQTAATRVNFFTMVRGED